MDFKCLWVQWEYNLVYKPHYDNCRNPTLRECEDEIRTPEMGTWESSGTPESLELDCKGQNTLHWGVLWKAIEV
jgi:hypothetical protein